MLSVVRGALRLRYWVLGGAVGGGVTLKKKYSEWQENLPDLSWLDDVLPDAEKLNKFTGTLISMRDNISNIEIDSRLKALSQNKYYEVKQWFGERWENAIEAAEKRNAENVKDNISNSSTVYAKVHDISNEYPQPSNSMYEEMMQMQASYQRKLDELESENRELRKQNLLLRGGRDVAALKKTKKSLIEMYSEVLDELAGYGGGLGSTDQLPRVVVVGDQSAGKTSVLEMVAQARIFPRGAGEMMTRAPVKVTLSEGPYHVAQFRDSTREFDLTKESDLSELRREVELRMRNSVRNGRTVSHDVISMSVRGPGLHRMVLVDLPGIISTQTVDMASDTKDSIKKITQDYMNNPNAIILCIQDGSVDAERSNVTDLVSQCDPSGKRTIFVLTKVDMAEENLTDPNRIRKILSGKLFPMKALGYFAVVTGRGHKDDSIKTIKEHEEKFFRNSKLFKDGLIMSSQLTTRNLSLAVADCFWKMVLASVEQQADAFKAMRFNLETEWKNNYPRTRELDRDELFERARGEILDESVNLSMVAPSIWETRLLDSLWQKTRTHVFENIYLPAAMSPNSGTFNTTVDIKLKQWAEESLPEMSVNCGWETVQLEFQEFIRKAQLSPNHDDVFDNLKGAVVEEAVRRHKWEDKASEMVRVLQLNALQDRALSSKRHWDEAIQFLEQSVNESLKCTEENLKEMTGPSFKERWFYWQNTSDEQERRKAVISQLEDTLKHDYSRNNAKHPPTLSYEELAAIRKTLQNKNLDVDSDYIRDTWHQVYRRHFLKRALSRAYDCRKGYYLYVQSGMDIEMDCSDVILFWRIRKMMKMTANALRQQITNREARRLDKELKDILEEYSQDGDRKKQLLTGRRVVLAEDLKKVRHIQEKLEEFILSINKEK
ncbi:opa1 mitochondrial dynamin like GTPase isoform X2 [Arctopsyche grandis]|uniref:opa1 mitochondrial dynamin like GTPase isoform X2 n=1 Tax=Arctopsyche grandis TaxID=121162 RepID=UPI00406D6685